MTLRRSRWLQAFVLLPLFLSFSTAWLDERPILEVRDGNLFITSAKDKNITLQTTGASYVNVNGINLLYVAKSAYNASKLVERWNLGILADMESTLRRLADAIEGPSGLQRRVSVMESGSGSERNTTGRPIPPYFPNRGAPGNDIIARSRIQRLTTRVRQTEVQLMALRRKLETDECASNPCQNGGTCEDRINGYKCMCLQGWEGPECNIDIDECTRFAGTDLGCQNQATCLNLPGTYHCNCKQGWHGIHCTKQTMDCNSENSMELCGHGVCVNKPGSALGYTCICDQGWVGDSMNPACINDYDECANKHPPCSVNPLVQCVNVPGSFYCGGCPQGYTGNGYYCSDIDECATYNGGCSTTPLVQCINTMGSRICGSCPTGYQGDGVTCSYVGACRINNGGCHPLATCSENPGLGGWTVQCMCPAGYQGSGMGPAGCIVNADNDNPSTCSSNPCSHGTCSPNGPNDYRCQCASGYTGKNCDVATNPCEPNPCRNGGICSITVRRRAICRCTTSFSGPRCETARESCGGYLQDPMGTLLFPSSSKTYQHDLSCAWVWSTNTSNVLNITFTAFDLESSRNCQFDFVQIHDGATAGDHMLGRFCGSTLPNGGNIISSTNNLYLWFHSDNSVSHDGFTLQWETIAPVCGGVLTRSHGSIMSPGSPGRYPTDRDCRWYVTVDPGKRIQFNFFHILLEEHPTCQYDYLEIRDGPSDRSQLLGLYCNHTNPAPLITSGSEAWLHFHSDSSGQDSGFQITFSTMEGSPGCGGVYTASSGYITSPNHGIDYESNLDCEWKIQIPTGERIKITWMSFALERSRGCNFDFVEIYNGANREAQVVGRYCGDSLPPDTLSDSNILLVRFRSDWSFNGAGFRLKYEVWCGGQFTEETGVIKSPFYPNPYPASRTCIYEIIQPTGKGIVLTLEDMDIEGTTLFRCTFDYLQVRDGDNENSTLIDTYCGTNSSIPEFPLISTHNYMWLKFQTDNSNQRRGFMATYTTVDHRCGGIFKTAPGIIETPSINGKYGNYEDCTWIIQAPPGFAVQLHWLTFNLEYQSSCRHDYIKITENITSTSQHDMGTYCGSTKPPMLISQTRMMSIKFHTDISITRDGFTASYTFIDASKVCGGRFYSLTGVITSPNYPENYPQGRQCEWIIEAPNKHQVVLHIKNFTLEAQFNCIFDYLEIRNGGSDTSPLIKKYCGTVIPKEITSFGNQMYLKFVTDDSRSHTGFFIEWDSNTIGCGGSLTTTSGSIFSPNYPQPYSEYSDCTWNIRVSAGSFIQLILIDIELENHEQCTYDFIEIYEGLNRRGKKLGKYCGTQHPMYIQTTSNLASIRFRSDYSGAGRGFHISYNTLCHTKLHGYRGVIESLNFPNNYPDQANCSWIIEAPLGNKLNITFSHFDLEAGREDTCMYDYLDIKEGEHDQPNREIAKLCGSTELPPKIVSTQRQVFLTFHSDIYLANNGFRLEWVVNGCGGTYDVPEATITSPGYPGAYPENIDCEWTIEVDQLHSIEVTLEDVNLEKTQGCTYDKLIIYSGSDATAPKLIETCHTERDHPVNLTSSSNKMFIKFHADSSFQSSGFKLHYKTVDIQCGGKFTTISGLIHSAQYPNNYPPNQNCEWLIQVPINQLINLTFADFDIEDTRNCTDDYVRIYDGGNRSAPVLGSHCHNLLPPSYISSSNELLVVMRSDSVIQAKGFKATYEMACGARIVTNGPGMLSMNSAIGLQTDMHNCTWTVVAEDPADHVTLTFTDMQFVSMSFLQNDCQTNSIQVFEGQGMTGPLVNTWCSTKVPAPITSQGNSLTVHISSLYGTLYMSHFSATYSVVNSACGGNYTSEQGTIATPGYPHNYPRNIECVWYLRTSPGNSITLSFEQFDVLQSPNCDSDYVEVREENGIGKLFGAYCGQNMNPITSFKSLWVKFRSGADGTNKGFIADYNLVHGNDLSGPSGDIASPLYPNPCMLHGDYYWRIVVDSTSAIQITFKDFHIEQFDDDCYIYLTIYNGYDENAPELMTKCGLVLPERVQSASNVVYIKFSTNPLREGSWFLLSWLEVTREFDVTKTSRHVSNTECDEIIALTGVDNTSYTFNSPGWPEGYDRNLDCSWTFESVPGTHLTLTFDNMDLVETSSCTADIVKIYSGNSLTSQQEWSHIGDFCYRNSTRKSIEATNLMKVQFQSNVWQNKTGFKATVRKVCGGQLSGPNGVIEVNGTTNTAGPHSWILTCQWNVTVRPGRTIEVKFIDLDIPSSSEPACSYDYLMLKNGGSASSPLLGTGKYCGNSKPNDPLRTTGNQLHVKFMGRMSSDRFKLTYSEIGLNCGGEILLSKALKDWEISSPNYPNIPSPHSECFWTIMAPAGEQIMIHFIERFDMTFSLNCQSEYLEIRDGGTELSRSMGRYCRAAPSSMTTTGNVMYLHYYTDVTEPKNGFQAVVSISDTCGGVIRDQQGVIRSPNYPSPYNSNVTCIWYIIGATGHTIKLQFQDLDTPMRRRCNISDYIKIYDETAATNVTRDPSTQAIGEYCGSKKPETVIESAGNRVVVIFTSNILTPSLYRGFSINFTTSIETCGGQLFASEGEFSSPGYPNGGRTVRFCDWQITVPVGYKIQIDILDFDLGEDDAVRRSYPYRNAIRMHNDFHFRSSIKNLRPSDRRRRYFSTSNTMNVAYEMPFTAHRGFKAHYKGVIPPMCGGTVTDIQGTLLSNQDPIFNMSSFHCYWNLNSTSINLIGHTLALRVSGLVGLVSGGMKSRSCPYLQSYISVTSGASAIACIYGNLTQDVIVRSPSPITTIIASTRPWATPTINYSINYKWHHCGGILGGPSHIISAPLNLTHPVDCAWHAKFPDNGETISLNFTKLNLKSCETNYIIIRNGGPTSPKIGVFCGSLKPNNIISQSNELWIEYHAEDSTNEFELQLATVQGGCGGLLEGKGSSAIFSPGFPGQYPNNAECIWEIRVEEGYHIGLVFVDRFQLETSVNCTNDFIEVFDYISEDETSGTNVWSDHGKKICGRDTPKPFNSTAHRMKILFRSNNALSGDGFHAQWNANCGGVIKVSNAKRFLVSPGWPNGYKGLLSCNFTFVAPGKKLIVEFLEFELEHAGFGSCRYDNVSVIKSEYVNRVPVWCGSDRPPIQRVNSRLELHFKTDAYTGSRGFKLQYYVDECGGEITSPTEIKTPSLNNGNTYYERINCTWTVTAPHQKAVVLRFETFHLEYSRMCYYDFVAVYAGLTIDAKNRLALLCGTLNESLPVLRAENGTMTINFITDRYSNFGGFKAKILFTTDVAAGCGGEIQLTQSQTFRTQSGSMYEALEDCHWLVRAPIGNAIKFRISSIDLKNSTSAVNQIASCSGDYLEIRDGEGPFAELIAKYCGNVVPPSITSSTNAMWIRLVTDGSLNGNGVTATFDLIRSPCGDPILTVGNQTKVLTSSQFPNMYEAGLRCRWSLSYPGKNSWKRFTIHFNQFDTEDSENCNDDRLSISDKNVRNYISEGFGQNFIFSGTRHHPRNTYMRVDHMPVGTYVYCGSSLPHDYYSAGDEVEITFQSSPNPKGRHSGFKLEYSLTLCNRNFTSAQGRILHHDLSDCWFTITAPVGYTISLYFNEFTIYDDEGCTNSALQVRDGDFSSTTLALLCGMTIPNPIFSSGNRLSLHSWSESSSRFESYDITYTTTDKGKGCGGKLYNYGGKFSSPSYPGQYRNLSECTWEVSVPTGYVVVLQFTIFDIGLAETCDTDYMDISDVQPNGESLSTTRHCGGSTPATYNSAMSTVKVTYKTSVNNGGIGWVISFMAQRHKQHTG